MRRPAPRAIGPDLCARAAPAAVWKDRSTPRDGPLVKIGRSETLTETPDERTHRPIRPGQIDVKQLTERPGNLTLLRLYALFKQATDGDAHGDKPGFTDIVGKYKYDAWEALKGTSQDAAKQQYIELVESLKNGTAS